MAPRNKNNYSIVALSESNGRAMSFNMFCSESLRKEL